MDETYIGGKPRKGVNDGIERRGRGTKKVPVVGMVERDGKIKAKAIKKEHINLKNLMQLVRKSMDIKNTILITDQATYYHRVGKVMAHETINHRVCYSIGDIHTNNIELLGRTKAWYHWTISQSQSAVSQSLH